MKEIKSKEELKKSLDAGEKHFIVTDKKLLKALAVRYWMQNNKVKGGLLLAALPAAIAVGGAAAPVIGIVGAGLVVGGVTISAAEIIIVCAFIIALAAVLRGQQIDSIDVTEGKIHFK